MKSPRLTAEEKKKIRMDIFNAGIIDAGYTLVEIERAERKRLFDWADEVTTKLNLLMEED